MLILKQVNPTKLQTDTNTSHSLGMLCWTGGQTTTVAGVNHAVVLLCVLDSEFSRSSQICTDPRDASILGLKGTLLFPKIIWQEMMCSVWSENRIKPQEFTQNQGIGFSRFLISRRGLFLWALMGWDYYMYLRDMTAVHAYRSGFTQSNKRPVRRIGCCVIFTGSSKTWLTQSLIILSSPTQWRKPQGERRTPSDICKQWTDPLEGISKGF